MSGPLSAFAARQATKAPIQPALPSPPNTERLLSTNDRLRDNESFEPPKKKRRKARAAPKPSRAELVTEPSLSRPASRTNQEDVPSIDEGLPQETSTDEQSSDSESGLEIDSGLDEETTDHAISRGTAQNICLSKQDHKPNAVSNEIGTDWMVKLGRNDTLSIIGQYDIWVRKGAIGIAGAVLHASSELHRVYAPSTHAIPVIRPSRDPFGSQNHPVEVTIKSCGSGHRMLKHIAPKFGRIWNGQAIGIARSGSSARRSFINLQWSSDDVHQRPLRPLELPQDWQSLINRLVSGTHDSAPSKVLVCGPKGSGKSTFCRWLANALLSLPDAQRQSGGDGARVLFLDLDPGQPEYSAPGEISLLRLRSWNLGVPFSHPTASPSSETLIRSHFIGSRSPKEDPKHYLVAALDLLQTCYNMSRTASASAVVINCSGWIQGKGLELIKDIVLQSNLTDLIYTSTAGPDEVVHTLSKACKHIGSALHQVSSQPYQDVTRTASELRAMQSISYFHVTEPEAGNLRWDGRPLTHKSPVMMPYAGPKQAIFAVMVLGDEQNSELYPAILDGSVVGVVLVEDNTAVPGAMDSIDANAFNDDVDDQPPAHDESLEDRTSITIHDTLGDLNEDAAKALETPSHLTHLSISRTSTGIPYMPPTDHTVSPLAPARTRCVGQALICGIDAEAQCFLVSTPIPALALQDLHKQKRKIVIVRGKLDTPTWAYKEEFEYDKSRRRRREKSANEREGGNDGTGERDDGEEAELRAWAERQPWISVAEGRGKGKGKARRIRRDIRYRGQGDAGG